MMLPPDRGTSRSGSRPALMVAEQAGRARASKASGGATPVCVPSLARASDGAAVASTAAAATSGRRLPSSKLIEPIATSFWGDEEMSRPKKTRRREPEVVEPEVVATASTVDGQHERQLKLAAKRDRERLVLEKRREAEQKQAQLVLNERERSCRLAAESRRVTLRREWEVEAKRQAKVEKKVLSSIKKMALREQQELKKKRRIELKRQYAAQRAQEVKEEEEFAEWQRQDSVKLYREREQRERDLCEKLASQRLVKEKQGDGFGAEEVPVPVTPRSSVLRRKSDIAMEACKVSQEAALRAGGECRSKAAPYDGDAWAFEVTPDHMEALPVVPSERDTWESKDGTVSCDAESAHAGDTWTAAASQQRAAAAVEAKAWRVEVNSNHDVFAKPFVERRGHGAAASAALPIPPWRWTVKSEPLPVPVPPRAAPGSK